MFVYADHAATAPLRKTALDAMMPFLTDNFGNASSMYTIARDAKKSLDNSRQTIAACLGVDSTEIFFTSGGTEGDNWAFKGLDLTGKHIITTCIEHHAVLHTIESFKQCEVTYLAVDKNGQIDINQLRDAVRENTAIVSIMMANNEIGSILPVQKAFEIVKQVNKKIICHTDAVQAVGHIKIDMSNIDILTASAHKFGGPKGIGFSFIRKGMSLKPLLHGGGHERGKRSSTENVAGAAGMSAALKEATDNLESNIKKTEMFRDKLIKGILEIPYSHLTGNLENRLPGNASFIFECVEGETLVLGLDMNGICSSSGSACSSGSLDPSHVLLAIGLPQEIAHGSLRLSIDENVTEEQIDFMIEIVTKVVSQRRNMSPLWNEKEKKPTERFW